MGRAKSALFTRFCETHRLDRLAACRRWVSPWRVKNAPWLYPSYDLRVASPARRHSLVQQPRHARPGAGHIDVALGGGGDVMAAAEHARIGDRAGERHGLAVKDRDV